MSFELPAAHRELLERARETADKVRWRATEADAAADVDPVMREALQASGLVAVTVPAAQGGASERVDPLAVTDKNQAQFVAQLPGGIEPAQYNLLFTAVGPHYIKDNGISFRYRHYCRKWSLPVVEPILFLRFLDFNYLTAVVVATMGTNVVRQLRLVTVRTITDRRHRYLPVSAALAPSGT